MINKIVALPVKAVKGTYKVASLAYKAASAVLFGAAVYKGVQKVREARVKPTLEEMPPIPDPPVESRPKPERGAVKKPAQRKATPKKRKPAAKKK